MKPQELVDKLNDISNKLRSIPEKNEKAREQLILHEIQLLEDNGWREECPEEKHWAWRHPKFHGIIKWYPTESPSYTYHEDRVD